MKTKHAKSPVASVSCALHKSSSPRVVQCVSWDIRELSSNLVVCVCRSGRGPDQRTSLLWTHTQRPLYSRPIALTQEGRSQVDDVCECMSD